MRRTIAIAALITAITISPLTISQEVTVGTSASNKHSLGNIQSQLSVLNSLITTLNNKLTDANAKIATLEAELAKSNTDISKNTTDIANFDGEAPIKDLCIRGSNSSSVNCSGCEGGSSGWKRMGYWDVGGGGGKGLKSLASGSSAGSGHFMMALCVKR